MKNRSHGLLIGLIALSAASAILPSCGSSVQKGLSDFSSGSGSATPIPGLAATPTPTPAPTPPPSSVSMMVNFPVGFQSTTHENSNWAKPCAISTTDIASGSHSAVDINCTTEVMETDLFLNDFKVYWSATAGICDYLVYTPFYYWMAQPGDGTTTYTATYTSSGALQQFADTGSGKSRAGATGPMCNYDYTDQGGNNCCTGGYTGVVTRLKDDGTPIPGTVTVKGSWGGSIGNCIGGAGSELQRDKTYGLPISPYTWSSFGGAVETTVANSNASKRATNIWTANYVKTPASVNGPAFSQTFGTVTVTQPTYQLLCMDSAFEVKARINMVIREWNSKTEFNKGAAGDSDLPAGNEPNWPGNPYDDILDWDDIGTATYPGFIFK